ncbi:MAG: hypothetical protein VYC34_12560, partial [Planctomycetota bacterium]|nr:hypothetical protein [Planctomycetota bacterium]
MNHQLRNRIAAAALALLFTLPACGVKHTGVRIGDETLRQFQAGETTEAWLIAILGPPTSTSHVAEIENTKVFRYSLTESNNVI